MVKRIMMLLMLCFGVAFISACANEEFWCDNCSQMYTGSMNRAALHRMTWFYATIVMMIL